MQKVTRLALVVLLCHAAALAGANLLKLARGVQVPVPDVAVLHQRAAGILMAHGYQPVAEPPLRSRFLQKYGAYRVSGCGRSHWLFGEPLPENLPLYFNVQGLGAYVFRYYYEGVASDFPNDLIRQWTLYGLKVRHVLGMGPKPAGHFLMLAIPAECAWADVDLRPAYQRP